MSAAVIAISKLSKAFRGRPALMDLDLQVAAGEVVGLLGHNGAGKSTTIGAMLGQVRPDAGEVRLFGHAVEGERGRALARVGAIFESPAFWPYLSGWQCLQGLLAYSGRKVPRREVEETVAWVGLSERIGDRVGTYSHGMRQRLALAQALLPAPELLILDEPTNGLDPRGILEMRGLVRRLHAERGMTILLCSHLLHEVEQVCTRVVVLHRGRKVHDGAVAAAGGPLRLRLDCDRPQAARALLRTLGLVDDTSGDLLQPGAGREPADLVAALVVAGFRVQALVPEKAGLESFYIGLTDEADGAAEGGAA